MRFLIDKKIIIAIAILFSLVVPASALQLIIDSPQNITYNQTSRTINLNWSANESVDTWYYSLNGEANASGYQWQYQENPNSYDCSFNATWSPVLPCWLAMDGNSETNAWPAAIGGTVVGSLPQNYSKRSTSPNEEWSVCPMSGNCSRFALPAACHDLSILQTRSRLFANASDQRIVYDCFNNGGAWESVVEFIYLGNSSYTNDPAKIIRVSDSIAMFEDGMYYNTSSNYSVFNGSFEAAYGNNNLTVWANDSYGNVNYSTIYFYNTIGNCSVQLTQPGTYLVGMNLTNNPNPEEFNSLSKCINIAGNDIVLDCQNHFIEGYDVGSYYGVLITGSTNVTIQNCHTRNHEGLHPGIGVTGDMVTKSVNIKLINITDSTSDGNSLYAQYVDGIAVINATMNGEFVLGTVSNGIYTGLNISNTGTFGLALLSGHFQNNTFKDSYFIGNSYGVEYGAGSCDFADNHFYNNYFSGNTNHFFISPGCGEENPNVVYLNTTKSGATNILGYSGYGGNYWASYVVNDTNGDNIGDIAATYREMAPTFNPPYYFNSTDYLPLIIPIAGNITMISPDGDNNWSYSSSGGAQNVFNITISTSGNINSTCNFISNSSNFTINTGSYNVSPGISQTLLINISSTDDSDGVYSFLAQCNQTQTGTLFNFSILASIAPAYGDVDIVQSAWSLAKKVSDTNELTFTLQNRGNYELTGCNMALLSSLSPTAVFTLSNFGITNSTNASIQVRISGGSVGTDNNARMTISCISTPVGGIDSDVSFGSISIVADSVPASPGSGGGGGGAICAGLYEKCKTDSNCCGGLVCTDKACSYPGGLSRNMTFNVYPRLIQPDPRFRLIMPGATFTDVITIFNVEQNPEKIMTPMFEFICSNETACMASWCNFSAGNNQTVDIPPFTKKDYSLTCKIPASANTELNCTAEKPNCNLYTVSISIWADGYDKDLAQAVSMTLIVTTGTLIKIPALNLSEGYNTAEKISVAIQAFLFTPFWCLSESCQDSGMPYTPVMENPFDLGPVHIEGVNIALCAVIILLIIAVILLA